MTEDEAKKRWCPFARVRGVDGEQEVGSWNRIDCTGAKSDSLLYQVGADLTVTRCIGSACMAFRWEKELANKAELEKVANMMAVGSGYHRIEPEYRATANGFCGLAGKP